MKTYQVNAKEVKADWKLIDAEGKVLGRIASEAARILRGKHKAIYTPSVDCGDHVVIINAEKAVLSGIKADTKSYFRHSTRPGGGKFTSYREALEKDPGMPMSHAIRGMLPKTALGDKIYKKLHVYGGAEHNHAAQKPEPVAI